IAMGPYAPNHGIMGFGAEGLINATQTLEMSGNIILNDYGSGTDVYVYNAPSSGSLSSNLFVGGGTSLAGATSTITESGDRSYADRASAGLNGQFPVAAGCSGPIGTLY